MDEIRSKVNAYKLLLKPGISHGGLWCLDSIKELEIEAKQSTATKPGRKSPPAPRENPNTATRVDKSNPIKLETAALTSLVEKNSTEESDITFKKLESALQKATVKFVLTAHVPARTSQESADIRGVSLASGKCVYSTNVYSNVMFDVFFF